MFRVLWFLLKYFVIYYVYIFVYVLFGVWLKGKIVINFYCYFEEYICNCMCIYVYVLYIDNIIKIVLVFGVDKGY